MRRGRYDEYYPNERRGFGRNRYDEYQEEYMPYNQDMRYGGNRYNHRRYRPMDKILRGIIIKVLLILLALYLIFLLVEASATGDSIVDIYCSLTARVSESSVNFDKRLSFVTTNTDGTVSIEFGWKDEYTKSTGEVSSAWAENNPGSGNWSGSSGSGAGWDGDGIALNAMDMYNSFTYSGVGGVVSNVSINGVNLYTGIPWADDGNWYMLDENAVNQYTTKNLGKPVSYSSAAHSDPNNSGSPINKDGVNCVGIAWFPIFSFCDVNEDGSYSPAWGGGLASQFKGVAVLEKGGSTYYLPICSGGDNKGHVFPGGLVQTYIDNDTRLNPSTGIVTFENTGHPDSHLIKWNGAEPNGMQVSLQEFRQNWGQSTTYNGSPGVANCGHPQFHLECNGSFVSALSGYSVTGFIIHKN